MPFQDIEETAATPIPRTPLRPERWLRKLFLEDWGLKAARLAITSCSGSRSPSEQARHARVSGVQLNYLRLRVWR